MRAEDWFLIAGFLLLLSITFVIVNQQVERRSPEDIRLKVTSVETVSNGGADQERNRTGIPVHIRLEVHEININETPSQARRYQEGGPAYVVVSPRREGGPMFPIHLHPAQPRVEHVLRGRVQGQQGDRVRISYNLNPVYLDGTREDVSGIKEMEDLYLKCRLSPRGEITPLALQGNGREIKRSGGS